VDQQPGSAAVNGELWGERARDWSELQEGILRPDFEECIRRTAIGHGTKVLDLGCGAGGFCRLAVGAGARVTGIDAAAGMVEIARERVPDGRFDVGDIQFLPYEDRSFDVVAGFHSLPFAADPLAALREAVRVAKPGGSLFVVIFGREEHNQLAGVLGAIRSLLPARPGAPGPTALSGRGVLDELLARVGVLTVADGVVEKAYEYPDLDTALRAIRSAGLTVLAERTADESAVSEAISCALAPYRIPGGGYRLDVESRYVLATPTEQARHSDIVSSGVSGGQGSTRNIADSSAAINDNKQTLARFDRLVEACKAEQLDEICTPDMRNHALASHRTAGLEGTKELLRECREDQGKAAWLRALHGERDLITIAEGDYVIQYGTITSAWPGGPFRSYQIPAGDYQCDVAFMYRFKNGRIAERWAVRDDLAMIQQLSGTPAPNDG
jgi:SAM-dependent methyltransferase/predicted ester cyclase